MAERYIVETYSDGRTNTSTLAPDISSEVGSLAGGVMAAGGAAVLALGFGASALDAKAEAKHYSGVNAAAVAYERNPSAVTEQKLIDSLKYLTGAKIKLIGWGSLSMLLKYLGIVILLFIPPFGAIYLIYQIFKYNKALKGRRENALKIAKNYGLEEKISKYMYSIVGRICMIFIAWQTFVSIVGILASLFS